MAELADAPDLGSGFYEVQVRLLLSADFRIRKVIWKVIFRISLPLMERKTSMKDFKPDSKYLKISIYAGATVLVTAVALMLLYLTGGVWAKLWAVFMAILKPLIVGVVLCYLLLPIVNWFEKLFTKGGPKSWARLVAVILTYVLILLAILILLALIILTMYKSFSAISIEGIKSFFLSLSKDVSGFEQLIKDLMKGIGLPVDKLPGIFGSLVSGIAGFFSLLLFGVIFSVYFLLDGQRIGTYLRRVFTAFAGQKNNEDLTLFLDDVDQVFSGYIRGQFLDAIIVAVITSAGLSIVGVPSAIVVGIFTGLGNLIPYFGPVVGYVATAIVCIPGGNWKEMIIGFVMIAVLMFVDGNIINPRLLSNSIEVHALLVIAALLGGGVIGGLVGMIVAVPIAALLKLQLDRYLEKKEKKEKKEE